MKASSNEWQALTRPLLLLCLAALACYAPVLDATFFSDDDIYLAFKNVLVREAHWAALGQFFVAPSNPWEYLPLRDITYWLDFQLYEDESFGFHLTNLLWYAAASGAAWWLFRELLLLCGTVKVGDALTIALVGVVVFIVHPSHVEAVAWVASRKDLVGGALSLLAIAWAARLGRRDAGLLHWGLLGLLILVASLGKSTAVVQVAMVVVVIVSVENTGRTRVRSSLFIRLLLVVVPAIVAVWLHTTVASSTGIRLENDVGSLAILERSSRILAQLVLMLVYPYPLGFYHSPFSIGEWHWLLSCTLLLLNCAALFSLSARPQLWAFGVLLISVSMLPYLQLVPFSTWSLASERFLFVSVAGLSIIVIDLLSRLKASQFVLMLLIAIVVVCCPVILGRLQDWRSVALLRAAEQVRVPEFHNAKRDLIVYQLLPEGRYEEARAVAASLPRDYVRELLGRFIDYWEAAAISGDVGIAAKPELLCSREELVWAAVTHAQTAIRFEHDLSINNIVRWVEQNMPQRNAGSLCRDPG